MARTQLKGLDEALEKMEKMRLNAQKKHARKAARKAAKTLQDAARANARKIDDPDTSAAIHKNIVIRSGKTKDKGSIKVRVGVKGGGEFWKTNKKMQRKGRGRVASPYYTPLTNDTRHFWLVEFGTAKTAAQPYLRPAFAAKKGEAEQIFTEELKKSILEDIRT